MTLSMSLPFTSLGFQFPHLLCGFLTPLAKGVWFIRLPSLEEVFYAGAPDPYGTVVQITEGHCL